MSENIYEKNLQQYAEFQKNLVDSVFKMYGQFDLQKTVQEMAVAQDKVAKGMKILMDMKPEDAELVGKLLYRGQQIAKDLGLEESGARFVFNCKEDAGQTVFHIHLHVVGGQKFGWPPFPVV